MSVEREARRLAMRVLNPFVHEERGRHVLIAKSSSAALEHFTQELTPLVERVEEAEALFREWQSVGILAQYPAPDSPWGKRVSRWLGDTTSRAE